MHVCICVCVVCARSRVRAHVLRVRAYVPLDKNAFLFSGAKLIFRSKKNMRVLTSSLNCSEMLIFSIASIKTSKKPVCESYLCAKLLQKVVHFICVYLLYIVCLHMHVCVVCHACRCCLRVVYMHRLPFEFINKTWTPFSNDKHTKNWNTLATFCIHAERDRHFMATDILSV